MRYENLLASRYIKAQKRQSFFTCVSIIAAVAVMTMIFVLYSVCMDCMKAVSYRSAPYHLSISGLTAEQGEALQNEAAVRRVKLEMKENGTVTANLLFADDIGDREQWLQTAAEKIGAGRQWLYDNYQWNHTLMMLDGIGNNAKLSKLQIFCMFFTFAVLIAFALRLIIDTAFEVSSKERERHYGVLQSVGATPQQIVKIITSEALRLCAAAVPFGLVLGIVISYVMYRAVLAAGLADIFHGMVNAKLHLPFTVDWRMLLVSAAVGTGWVFLSAYGVGMRIIKKAPMEAIITRTDKVKKVRRHTLSGLLFGISGSIASRNARRQKKRFVITVLTLTVSITMFALFSALTESVERSITSYLPVGYYGYSEEDADSIDFAVGIGNPAKGISYAEAEKALADSGLFENIAVSTEEQFQSAESEDLVWVRYLNREAYTRNFGADAPVSYDELVSFGGYVCNLACKDYAQYAEKLQSGSLTLSSICRTLPEDADIENMSWDERIRNSVAEKKAHTLNIIGAVSREEKAFSELHDGSLLIGAIETHDQIAEEWFGVSVLPATAEFSFIKTGAGEYRYNAADLKKAEDWFKEHSDLLDSSENAPFDNLYDIKWRTHSIMAAFRAGVLLLNTMIALAALINLLNIISTGIANRRSELASLQCIGMTDRQLDRMAVIECLQFAGAAAVFSAVICALVIYGIDSALTRLINISFTDESEATRKMLMDLVRIDHVTPFVRVGLSSLAAFVTGCITSIVMLRSQNKESLTDQIRGSEMKLDTKKSHILRNSIIAVAGAFVLVIAGLRIYSVAAYHLDRNEYAKAGYLNLVDGADNKINVYSTGAQNGKHTIVGLAGMGVECFPVVTKSLNERLGKENTLVYPDRAGYGFSDDSYKSQSLEQVVEDYRAGLKNAGFNAPYVLMGHSYGSYYALWWQMKYPDEVESIVFLDGTWIEKNDFWDYWTIEEYPSESDAYAEARRVFLQTWLGLDRLFPAEEQPEGTYGKALLSEKQLALWDLTEKREWSAALLSEVKNEPEAARELRAILKPTDTPKLYFSTMPTCEADIRENLEFQNADIIASGKTPKLDPETAAKAEWKRYGWEYQDIYEKTLTPFMEKCGNCRLVSIGGDHGIFFVQKRDEVAGTILDFLAETEE